MQIPWIPILPNSQPLPVTDSQRVQRAYSEEKRLKKENDEYLWGEIANSIERVKTSRGKSNGGVLGL